MASSAAATVSVPKVRHITRERIMRIAGLRVAGELMGREALCDAMGVAGRTFRAWLGAERGIGDRTLADAAAALERRAAKLTEHAAKLRALTETGE